MTNTITICVFNTNLKNMRYIKTKVRPVVGDFIPLNYPNERVDKVCIPIDSPDVINECDIIAYTS